MAGDQTLYVLAGPTAVGKTDLSLQWAQAHDAEILSCDSTLFYRGVDIGTAKPTAAELAQVPHHGIDLVEVTTQLNIQEYLQYAEACIRDIHTRGKRVLIVGGSGFYLKAFYQPVVDTLSPNPSLRQEVQKITAAEGLAGLVKRLQQLNPQGTGKVDLHNPRRVARALERCLSTGQSVIALEQSFAQQVCPFAHYPKLTCLLMRDDAALKARIRSRARRMIAGGLIAEVEQLLQQGLAKNPSAAAAICYREGCAYLRGELADDQALLDEIAAHNWRLVKKQKAWFRKQLPIDQTINLSAVSQAEALTGLFRCDEL